MGRVGQNHEYIRCVYTVFWQENHQLYRVGQNRISPFQMPYIPYKTVFRIYEEISTLEI